MSNPITPARLLSMSLVICGNLIGAGILALPINTGLAGLWPSLTANVLMWLLMMITALILAGQKSLSQSETMDLPSFFQQELGTIGKWLTVVANLIILYGLLVAYLSGASSILHNLFKAGAQNDFVLLFFIIITGVTLFGMNVIRKGNVALMILMWTAFGLLVIMCARHMDASRFSYTDWQFLPAALPIVITAFHFHNLIPVLCRGLDHNQRAIRRAIFIGTGIGLVMNVTWTVVVIGGLPLAGHGDDTILKAFQQNLPATIYLSRIIGSEFFTTTAFIFALLAISTSYMANGTALTSFIRDLAHTHLHTNNRALASGLAFGPPLLITLIYPSVFLKALNLVGGVGIGLIFGVFPGVLLVKYSSRRGRLLGWVIVVAFAAVLVFELAQEFGLLQIHPDVEYWSVRH